MNRELWVAPIPLSNVRDKRFSKINNETFSNLLQRDEPRAVGGTNTWTTVLDRLVRNGELSQVMTNHLWLDLHLSKHLPVVDADNGTSHLWHHHHVTEVSLHHVRLLVDWSLFLLLAELLDEGHGLPL